MKAARRTGSSIKNSSQTTAKAGAVKSEGKEVAKVASQPSYEELILNHRENGRKLARSILRRWQVNLPAEDVDSIVDLTLCEAAARYNITKGASFITFLFYHLRGHLVRAVASATTDSQLFLALAQSAGLDVTEWSTANEDTAVAFIPDISFDRQAEVESPEVLLIRKERAGLCKDAVVKLDELEREIIDRSYGQDEPLVDIAKLLGYSRCHVSRVKKRALDRLRGFIGEVSVDYLAEISSVEVNDDDFSAASSEPKRNRRRRIELKEKAAA
jgi:RNA polymerase sigma factor for flagellar operon FliA